MDGFNVFFHDNGRVSEQGYFRKGHKIGKWYGYTEPCLLNEATTYNRNGKLKKLKIWDETLKRWVKAGMCANIVGGIL